MMKAALIWIGLVAILILSPTEAMPSKGSTKAALKNKPACLKPCDQAKLDPICAGDGVGKNRSFGSECVMQNHNCEFSQNLHVVSQGECPGGGGIRLS